MFISRYNELEIAFEVQEARVQVFRHPESMQLLFAAQLTPGKRSNERSDRELGDGSASKLLTM